jgi:hypothetical protein
MSPRPSSESPDDLTIASRCRSLAVVVAGMIAARRAGLETLVLDWRIEEQKKTSERFCCLVN